MPQSNSSYHIRVAILLGCLGIVLLGCSQDPEVKKQKHFSRGQEYLSQWRLEEAIIEFRNVIQIAPKFADGHNQLGRAYQRKSIPASIPFEDDRPRRENEDQSARHLTGDPPGGARQRRGNVPR